MSKISKAISQFLLYGGLDRGTYQSIRHRISEENKRSTNIFTLLGAVAFLITGISTPLTNQGAPVVIYYSGAALFVVMFVLNITLSKKLPIISDFFAVLFSMLLLGLGIYIAYGSSQYRTTMLLPLFGLVSLVFCYRPIFLVIVLVAAEATFLGVMKSVQTPELYVVNMVNTLIFSIIGLVGGLYTLSFKHQKYKGDQKNQTLLEKDVLTGLSNRYSWKTALDKVVNDKTPIYICSLDVNGLKKVNDTRGHLAGDELIIGAATCIHDVFGDYGETYRIGGDEFSVIIYKDFDEKKLRRTLDARTKYWEGKKGGELSISLGIAKLDFETEQDIEQAIHQADLEMYKEKQKYHELHD